MIRDARRGLDPDVAVGVLEERKVSGPERGWSLGGLSQGSEQGEPNPRVRILGQNSYRCDRPLGFVLPEDNDIHHRNPYTEIGVFRNRFEIRLELPADRRGPSQAGSPGESGQRLDDRLANHWVRIFQQLDERGHGRLADGYQGPDRLDAATVGLGTQRLNQCRDRGFGHPSQAREPPRCRLANALDGILKQRGQRGDGRSSGRAEPDQRPGGLKALGRF